MQRICLPEGGRLKKIVLFIRSLEVGGAERQFVALATGLHRHGENVHVLTFYPGGALRPELEAAGVAVADLGKRGRWDVFPFAWRLWLWLRRSRPDVLYSWLPTANTLSAIVGGLARVPCIVWGVRASAVDFSHLGWLCWFDFQATRIAACWADRIICNSEQGFRFHVAKAYPLGKMCIIENGIDTESYCFDPAGRRRLRDEWKVGAGDTAIGLVARLDPIKGHEIFLQAAALLASGREDIRFICIGDGPATYLSKLQALSESLGVVGRIVWAGPRSDLAAVYSAIDIATSSSHSEGFSNSIAEAMACERPCVVTDVGDSYRIVGETGWVVSANNPEVLANGWKAALTLPEADIGRRGVSARRRVVLNFSVARMVECTLEQLRQ